MAVKAILLTLSRLIFSWVYTYIISICACGALSLPSSLVTCGPITCDISYQYCDQDLLGTRPVCSLCADICSTNRIGTYRLFADHCNDVCPVYLHRQEQKDLTTAAETTSAPTTVEPSIPHTQLIALLLMGVLLLILACIILAVAVIVIKRRRNHYNNPRNRQHLQLEPLQSHSVPSVTDSGISDRDDFQIPGSTSNEDSQNVHTSTSGLVSTSEKETETIKGLKGIIAQVQTDEELTHPKSRENQPQFYPMVTNTGSGNFHNGERNNFTTWPLPGKDSNRPRIQHPEDDPLGERSDKELPLAQLGRATAAVDQDNSDPDSGDTEYVSASCENKNSKDNSTTTPKTLSVQITGTEQPCESDQEYTPNSDVDPECFNFLAHEDPQP